MKKTNETLELIHDPDFEDRIETHDIKKLKILLQKIENLKSVVINRSKLVIFGTLIFGLALIVIGGILEFKKFDFLKIVTATKTILIFFCMIFCISWSFVLHIWNVNRYEIKTSYVNKRIRSLQRQNQIKKEQKDKNYLDQLIEINNSNIDDYYQQVRKNSNNLLLTAITIGVIGFLFILVSLIIGAISNTQKDIIYLSTITGIFIDSFAGVFFIQYGNSTKNMKTYFDGLLLTQHKIMELKTNIEEKI